MAPSSRSDSLKAQKLDHDSFVAFDHAAAGHEGVRCTISGSLIAKPCTTQEVEFYEASALHPAFQEFMPTFIGTLSSADQQPSLALAAAAGGNVAEDSGTVLLPESNPSSILINPVAIEPAPDTSPPTTTAEPLPVTGSAAAANSDIPWVPSGGKKLETGISIVLENVASGFRRPNVLDVKLGVRLWADDAPPAKRAKLESVAKETTSGSLGFRIAGMKVWTGHQGETDEGSRTDPYETKYEAMEAAPGEVIEKDGYRRYNKWYGRSFNQDNVKEGFATFLAGAKLGPVDRSRDVARRLADELRRVRTVLESEESRMYSSSALIVYEGDPDAMEQAFAEENTRLTREPDASTETVDEDGNGEFELPEGSSIEVVQINGVSTEAVNITIDPKSAQFANLAESNGEEDDDEEEEEEELLCAKVHDLRLIDFAHATWTPGQGPDENVLTGVRSLIRIFEELAGEEG